MFCNNCGTDMGDAGTVCPGCGRIQENASVHICEKCGYSGGDFYPSKHIRLIDLLITLWTFPFGILYLIYIYSYRREESVREQLCPKCKHKNRFKAKTFDKNQAMETIKNVAANKEVQESFKGLRKSLKDLNNTMDVDNF